MKPEGVSAVVVTRGDVDLSPILESLYPVGFHEILVWDNLRGLFRNGYRMEGVPVSDVMVFGRYAAVDHAERDLIYVQDDDCLIPAADLIAWADTHWVEPNGAGYVHDGIVANMPHSRWDDYPDSCLVGWGALFRRSLVYKAWARFVLGLGLASVYDALEGQPEPFLRECDAVFTTLTPHVKVDVGFEHLPWAEDPARAMFKREWRQRERDAMYELARRARDTR